MKDCSHINLVPYFTIYTFNSIFNGSFFHFRTISNFDHDYSEIYFQLLHIYTMKILNLLHSKISIEIG